jgi:PAS domain S-box-containing protein
MQTRRFSGLPLIGILAVIYFIAGKLGLMLASLHASASPVWPPAGIALAALLVLGYRAWPAIFVGAFLVNVTTAGNVATSLAIASGNTLEAVCGAWLLNRFAGGTTVFDRPQGVFKFALAAAVSTIISPAFGVTSLVLAGFADWTNYGAIWLTWWLGDTTGDLLIAPLIILWSIPSKRRWNRREAVEVGILLLLLLVLSEAVFGGWLTISARNYPIAFISAPIVIWTAFRFTQRETATSIFILSAIAIWGVMHGLGPFAGETENQSLLALQSWMAVLTISAMALSAGMAERGRAEEALRESEARINLAANAANLGLWLWNIPGDELWVTEKWRKLFGFADSEPVTFGRLLEVVHPGDRERMKQLVQHMIEHGGEYESEYRITRPDGSKCWILGHGSVELDEHGKPAFARGVSRDITKRKQAEEKFRLAVEASPSGILLVDQTGQIVLVNSQIEELFGYGREELIGQSVEILVPERFAGAHPEHRAKFFAAPAARAMGAGRELFARRKDGSEFPVEIGLNPIQTPEGTLVLAAVVDISTRLEAEEEARRRRQQVELLSRVSLLGEMTASLAHELNQPLAAIINNASAAMKYIERSRLDPAQLQEILTGVIGDGRRAFDIIRNVRSAIKKGSAIRGPINLNDVVTVVTHMVHPDAAANFCKVEMSLARDLPPIKGDPTQIQQVLLNLVRNAFDAMRDTPPSQRVVEIATNYNGDGTISIAVRDHGGGISEKTRKRLFEQFFSTKEEGLGMGLAIVRSIVEAHGGTIAAENADGGGARFHFRLPASEAMPQ